VEWRNAALRLGAAATFQQVLDAPGVPEVVRAAMIATASRTLRNMITVGGELGLCPPDSVLIPVLASLDAQGHVAGRRSLGIIEYRAARAVGPVGLIVPLPVLLAVIVNVLTANVATMVLSAVIPAQT
jgi:CO/xanthine dehydrogenase FAD-binding subunit